MDASISSIFKDGQGRFEDMFFKRCSFGYVTYVRFKSIIQDSRIKIFRNHLNTLILANLGLNNVVVTGDTTDTAISLDTDLRMASVEL